MPCRVSGNQNIRTDWESFLSKSNRVSHRDVLATCEQLNRGTYSPCIQTHLLRIHHLRVRLRASEMLVGAWEEFHVSEEWLQSCFLARRPRLVLGLASRCTVIRAFPHDAPRAHVG